MGTASGAARKKSTSGQPKVVAIEAESAPVSSPTGQHVPTSGAGIPRDPRSSGLTLPSGSTSKLLQQEQDQKECKCVAATPVNFKILEDGTMLEIVRANENAAKPSLLVCKSGEAQVVERYEQGDVVYVPESINPGVFTQMRFPSELARAADNTAKIIQDMEECIRAYVDIEGWSKNILSLFILATWIADRLTSVPYLLVQGQFGSGKTTLLKLLSCLCRRSLLLSSFTSSEFFSLPLALRPTLLLDETIINPEMSRLLRAGHTQDVPVMRKGQVLDLCCPKVISSRESILDTALVSRCIQIKLQRSYRALEILNSDAMRTLVQVWQPRLLAFRLMNFETGELPSLDTNRVSPRTRDLAKALGAIFPTDEQLRQLMVEGLVEQDHDTLCTESAEPAMFVLRAVFELCHNLEIRDDAVIGVGAIAKHAERIAKGAGEHLRFSPRAVGHHLRTLGFSTVRGRLGFGLWLSAEIKRRLHKMAREYGLCAVTSYCPYCLDFWPKSEILEVRDTTAAAPAAPNSALKSFGKPKKSGGK